MDAVGQEPRTGDELGAGQEPQTLWRVVHSRRDRHTLQSGDSPERRQYPGGQFGVDQGASGRAVGHHPTHPLPMSADVGQRVEAGAQGALLDDLTEVWPQCVNEVLGVVANRSLSLVWSDEDQSVVGERSCHQ